MTSSDFSFLKNFFYLGLYWVITAVCGSLSCAKWRLLFYCTGLLNAVASATERLVESGFSTAARGAPECRLGTYGPWA